MKKKQLFYKTKEEIELIRQSGVVLGKAHAEVAKLIRPGITTAELDKRAEEYILDNGGKPSFKGYNGFPASLCISTPEILAIILNYPCLCLYLGFFLLIT